MVTRKDSEIPKEYEDKLNAWKKKLKDKWDYERKLMVFEGSDGQRVTFTTTTSTTTTTPAPTPNVTTTNSTTFSPVVVLTTKAGEGRTGENQIASANTKQLITIVGITCGSLVALMICLLIFIRLCRGSSKKRKQRISLRRPLNPPEPEEHIYAEIEPLQRASSPGGASGNSTDVKLPSKKTRKRGVSSFRAISTRIYRFFSHDQSDNQSVSFNRNEQQTTIQPPEPPIRNTSPRKKRGAGVKRFESTASRRALLDGDSQISNTSVEMRPSTSSEGRDNIYNPLLRESDSRVSGPYDHLTLAKTDSNELSENTTGDPPESPHDYFTLESNANKTSPHLSGRGGRTHLSPVKEDNTEGENPLDTLLIENENSDGRVTSTHDYFVLEPHEKEKIANGSPSKTSVKSNKELENGSVTNSPDKKKEKPVAKPRVTKPGSPVKSNPSSPTDIDDKAITVDGNVAESAVNDMIDDANYIDPCAKIKDDIYVLSKLGTAPEPPPVDVDQEYLRPLDVKKRDYVDVFPNPPPRTTSLHPEEHGSQISQTQKDSPKKQSLSGSPIKQNSHESTV